jgi:hypothetical protein
MLVLVTLVMFLIVVIVAQLSSFVAMLIAHQQLQDEAEGFEMRAVNILNESDRTGRINLMTAASRELVFNTRKVYTQIAESSPELEPLASLYMDQSRQGSQVIATEREKIMSSTMTELRELAVDINKRNQVRGLLPWASTKALAVVDLDVGYSKDVESNVQAPLGNPELLDVDTQQRYFDRDTKLYYGNASLKLPVPDDDLKFKLSCLPAPVIGTVPQARIDEGRAFVKTLTLMHDRQPTPGSCEYFPSAARITFVRQFQSSLGVKTEQTISTRESGTTNGANPPQM